MGRAKLPLIALALAAALAAAAPGAASAATRDEAAATATKSFGGRVLSVEQSSAEGRAVWRVKLLSPEGLVRVVLVDAASGRPL